jgi:hypothetical protein
MNLDLSYCTGLETLPAEIGQLANLTNFVLNGCWHLERLPAKIGQLANLRNLE